MTNTLLLLLVALLLAGCAGCADPDFKRIGPVMSCLSPVLE